ncbi:MAG: tetratricopeptide repeat protein, partial [Defluviicoccus sp.]
HGQGVTAAGELIFGIVGALAAFPRRLAAREVERIGGRLQRGVSRQTTSVVFGRRQLRKADAAIEARVDAERAAGRQLVSENGFLRRLGLLESCEGGGLSRASLLDQSRLAPRDLDLLALFDALERDAEPFSFRDLILARKFAGLIAGGVTWGAVARSVHRSVPANELTATSLQVGSGRAIYACHGGDLSELDGQLLLDLGDAADDPEDVFASAEAAEEAGLHAEAAGLYQRCLALDPGDAIAAFNRANCLRAAGRPTDAEYGYILALHLDPGFVEAWFNLAGLTAERGRPGAARRHLEQAIALDPGYADAVFNLAALEFETGNLGAARRWWQRYLELDADSGWARTAARGLQFVALQSGDGHGRLRCPTTS